MRIVLFKYLFVFLGIAVVGSSVQDWIVESANVALFFPAWKTYTFHFSASAFLSTGIFVIRKYAFQSTGFAFVGGGLLKMALSVAFLYPLISSDKTGYIGDVVAFFIAYFVFLTAEVFFAARLLREE